MSIARLEYDLEGLEAFDLSDEGMGSLGFGHNYSERRYGEQIAEIEFLDDDGVPVNCGLYLDTDGRLYEMDVWKVDFSETIALR